MVMFVTDIYSSIIGGRIFTRVFFVFTHLDHVPPSNRLEFLVQPIHGLLRSWHALRRHVGLVAAPYQDLLLRAQLLLHRGHPLRLRPIGLALVPVLLVLHQLDHLRSENSCISNIK